MSKSTDEKRSRTTINFVRPELLEKAKEKAKAKFRGNLSAYIESLLTDDLDEFGEQKMKPKANRG